VSHHHQAIAFSAALLIVNSHTGYRTGSDAIANRQRPHRVCGLQCSCALGGYTGSILLLPVGMVASQVELQGENTLAQSHTGMLTERVAPGTEHTNKLFVPEYQ
jgi:hypothetical protein